MKRLMLIGDSIRLNYQEKVKEELAGEFDVWGSEDNCRFAKYTLNELGRLFSEFSNGREDVEQQFLMPVSGGKTIVRPDVIHWNNGLWDTAIVCKEDGAFTPVDEYISYMSKILRELRKVTDKVIFATTTPVKEPNLDEDNNIITEYNKRIVEFMKENGVYVNDLNALVSQNPDKYLRADNIHLSDDGIALCAKAVADCVRDIAR